jgi:transposase
MPPKAWHLGRNRERRFHKIVNFHLARVSSGSTEALNTLNKRTKRIGFGFRNFESCRIRALLSPRKPN